MTTNLPFDERTEVFGSERLTGALLDRLTNHVNILEMNGGSYRLKRSRDSAAFSGPLTPHQALGHRTPAEVFHQAVAAPSEESKTEKGSPKQMLVSSTGATGPLAKLSLIPVPLIRSSSTCLVERAINLLKQFRRIATLYGEER